MHDASSLGSFSPFQTTFSAIQWNSEVHPSSHSITFNTYYITSNLIWSVPWTSSIKSLLYQSVCFQVAAPYCKSGRITASTVKFPDLLDGNHGIQAISIEVSTIMYLLREYSRYCTVRYGTVCSQCACAHTFPPFSHLPSFQMILRSD